MNDNNFSKGQLDFFELAKNAPEPKDDSFFNDVKDYSKTIAKGAFEGISSLGRMFGASDMKPEAITSNELTENLDNLLPTDEGFTQKALRRGLKEAPTAIATGGRSVLGTGARALASGFIGEGVKELGGGDTAQSIASLTAFMSPEIAKKLLISGKDKDIIKFGKEFGLTDKQITPLIQSETKQKWLSKLAPKRGATQKSLEETRTGLGNIYNKIGDSKTALGEISEKANGKLINGIYEKLNSMPREIRTKIEADVGDLLNNKITGKSLINLWGDINSKYSMDKKVISTLKEPIKQAINSLSPELANDFEMINKMYSKFYPIASKLKPRIGDDIVSSAEAIGAIGSIIGALYGYYPALFAIAGEKGARHISKNMLINPKFQQLSQKMVNAIKGNKFEIAKNITEDFKREISKLDKSAGEKIEKLSEEDFQKLFNQLSTDK